MTLKDRCVKFIDTIRVEGSPDKPTVDSLLIDNLVAFVTTEIGRASDRRLEDSVPLALYFATIADREEFIAIVMEAKPGWISKRWPVT